MGPLATPTAHTLRLWQGRGSAGALEPGPTQPGAHEESASQCCPAEPTVNALSVGGCLGEGVRAPGPNPSTLRPKPWLTWVCRRARCLPLPAPGTTLEAAPGSPTCPVYPGGVAFSSGWPGHKAGPHQPSCRLLSGPVVSLYLWLCEACPAQPLAGSSHQGESPQGKCQLLCSSCPSQPGQPLRARARPLSRVLEGGTGPSGLWG